MNYINALSFFFFILSLTFLQQLLKYRYYFDRLIYFLFFFFLSSIFLSRNRRAVLLSSNEIWYRLRVYWCRSLHQCIVTFNYKFWWSNIRSWRVNVHAINHAYVICEVTPKIYTYIDKYMNTSVVYTYVLSSENYSGCKY